MNPMSTDGNDPHVYKSDVMVKQKPEEKARLHIDKLLEGAGWTIQDYPEFNLGTSPGVAVREFPLEQILDRLSVYCS